MKRVDVVASGNKNMVTSSAVDSAVKTLGIKRDNTETTRKEIPMSTYAIGTVYYHHSGQGSYGFNFYIHNGNIVSIEWINEITDGNITITYDIVNGCLVLQTSTFFIASYTAIGDSVHS